MSNHDVDFEEHKQIGHIDIDFILEGYRDIVRQKLVEDFNGLVGKENKE